MRKEDDSFGERKMPRKEHVEAHGQEDKQEQHECRLPQRSDRGVRMYEQDHLLDDASKLKTTSRYTGYPSEAGAPSLRSRGGQKVLRHVLDAFPMLTTT